MIVAKWKKGFESLYKADANLVANEILEIGDNVSPKEVLDKAKQEDTELHKCFEWDDGIAAEKYRLSQAGGILRTLVIKREETESCTKPEIRRFYKTKGNEGYKPSEIVFRKQDEYEALVQRCRTELLYVKSKFSNVSEYQEVWNLID